MKQYRCPICGNTIGVGVTLVVAPTCNNPKHKTRPTVMEEKK
jgi:hypothetical protein